MAPIILWRTPNLLSELEINSLDVFSMPLRRRTTLQKLSEDIFPSESFFVGRLSPSQELGQAMTYESGGET